MHKRLTETDWISAVEGFPGYFCSQFEDFKFLDLYSYSYYAKLENALQPEVYKNYKDYTDFGTKYMQISTGRQLSHFLSSCTKEDLFVFQSASNLRGLLLLKHLNKRGFRSVVLNIMPTPHCAAKKEKKTLRNFFLQYKKYYFKIIVRLTKLLLGKKLYFDYEFCCGKKAHENLVTRIRTKSIVSVHSVSYDEYLTLKNQGNTEMPDIKSPYFVFIDQALTLHPDGARNFSEEGKSKYHAELLKALQYIKDSYKMEIVIAEHPRIQYDSDFWHGFCTVKGKTDALIKNATKVIGHYSTSLHLAYLCKKEIFLLYSSGDYFPYNGIVLKTSAMIGGTLLDMGNLHAEFTQVDGTASLTDWYTLLPDSKKSNKELMEDFFRSALPQNK